MENLYQIISIEQIPQDILFEGYYWYSNQQKPKLVFVPSTIQQSWFTKLPFVVEANFYSREAKLSIQVRNIDGDYFVAKADLSRLEKIEGNRVSYIGHDLEGKKYNIIEAWIPKADELLEGMETLIPAWAAFAGFENQ